ncbi:TATA box-binding protein-associated factor RNA polymerase I subunit A-like isoform X2 [Pimephales promelas]|uniref:TATA box-binding protein-associated factor RNA polymerase I subunit A-like isoform X2 n=1 Tax=Pimephales promelas TaxID=90988 RepID=UPI001955B77A|nr:TATA box-binding protein-associated factor RNA polymerase I subunit A-like isoform X2 [Pimephales promelas]
MDDIEADDFPQDELTNRELFKSPVNHELWTDDKGVPTEIFFNKSNRKCLKRLRDAMLLHNWQEAAVYYNSYIQALEARNSIKVHPTASEITWRIGTEILRHLPNATAEDFNAVNEQLKNNGVKNFSKICLEHCFHLLLNGQMEEAKRQLSVGESWRYGNFSIAQGDAEKLIHAYSGFLDYLIWWKKSSTAGTDEASRNNEMHSYFRHASVTLKDIISQPGIWDPFVLGYVNMLEFYNDEDGALQILENYAYNKDFPTNPNAHVYLYQFLKRHNAPDDRLIGSLRILRTVVPSHELMLDLCSLLLSTSLMSDLEEALSVSMDLLEFSSWKSDVKAWSCLLNIIKLLKRKKRKHFVLKEWKVRRPLWFSFHFRIHYARVDIMENASLLLIKSETLKVLGQHFFEYRRYAQNVSRICESKMDTCPFRKLRKRKEELEKKRIKEEEKKEMKRLEQEMMEKEIKRLEKEKMEKKNMEEEMKRLEKENIEWLEKKKMEKKNMEEEMKRLEKKKMKKKRMMEKKKKKMKEKLETEEKDGEKKKKKKAKKSKCTV